jgi:mannose-6-phosphate isomerase-like protein (cupin superfamily)
VSGLTNFVGVFIAALIPQNLSPGAYVVKAQGEFVWHKHDETDDVFLVLKGNLTIELRDREIQLGPGELFVVPKGVEHRPLAKEEVHVLIIEPSGTPNTGDAATAAARRVI